MCTSVSTSTSTRTVREFLNGLEERAGNRDGVVSLAEWVANYEEVSASIDSEDYFMQLLASVWGHLKKPNSSKPCRLLPAPTRACTAATI